MTKPYQIVRRVRVSVRGLHSGFNSWINAVAVGNSGPFWMGAGGLTISRSRRPFRIANLRFILIEQRYSLHSGLLCMHEPVLHFICGFCANHLHNNAQSRLAASLPAVIRLSDRTGRFDEWQSRIRMEQSGNALSLKDDQLVFFFLLCLAYHFKWQTVIYLFIFLCDTFPTVLTARC